VQDFYDAQQITNTTFLPLAGGTMTGDLILNADPNIELQAATKRYVDNAIAGAVSQFIVDLASTANFSFTYDNGTSGVGATLTAGAPGAVSIDGTNAVINRPYLFKNQTADLENGIYTCTNDGSVTAAVFTRATFYNQPSEIQVGDLVTVNGGSTNAQTSWRQTSTVTAVGTDPITFLQYTVNPANFLQKANNLSDVNNAATSRTNLGLGSVATKTASNAALTNAVMQNGASTIGHVPKYDDITGSLIDSGFAISALVKTVKIQVFTSSGTYTPSTGMLFCLARVVGGGGQGGGAAGNTGAIAVGGGGGAGSYSESILTAATIGASKTVTIGAGGAGGGASVGGAGGGSSLGALVTTNGGNGGNTGLASNQLSVAAGGIGGVAGTGNVAATGNEAGSGFSFTTLAGYGGNGAASALGGGTRGSIGNVGTNHGRAGQTYGGGGSGAVSVGLVNSTGGVGAAGVVIIIEYCSQ
jgi:hypothetical protein